jgi:hypothetical protein
MTERVRLIVSPANEVQMVIVSESDTEDCSICLENTKENDTQLICGHIFHNECLREWLNEHTTCPVCRAILPILETKSPHTTVDLELPNSTEAPDRANSNRTLLIKLLALKTIIFFTFFVNYYAVQIIQVKSYGVDMIALLVVVEMALLYWGSYLLYNAWINIR